MKIVGEEVKIDDLILTLRAIRKYFGNICVNYEVSLIDSSDANPVPLKPPEPENIEYKESQILKRRKP